MEITESELSAYGVFGPITCQTHHALIADGIVGPVTARMLGPRPCRGRT
jgi:hypothetical protein